MSNFKFTSLLAEVPESIGPMGYYKEAQDSGGIESPDELQAEQDFAGLAYMFLQDRAPGLIKYLLGFEVVSRDEDGSRAVGMFGFKIGKDYYYAPSFFLNNQIKGLNLLLAKRTNTFVPLQEDWINFIVNRHSIELGSAAAGKDVQGDLEAPNFRDVTHPPRGKQASADDGPWPLGTAWEHVYTKVVHMLEKDAEFIEAVTDAIDVMQGKPLRKYAADEMTELTNWFTKVGGPNAVQAFFNTVTGNVKFASAALAVYPNLESMYVHKFEKSAMPTKAAAQLTVTTEVDADPATPMADEADKQRKRIIRHGFTINDTRPPEAKSEMFNVDYERMFYSPDTPGLYSMLLSTGATMPCWVFNVADSSNNSSEEDIVVVSQQDGLTRRTSSRTVFACDEAHKPIEGAYKAAVDLKDMEIGKAYLLINSGGNAVGPLRVRAVIEEAGKRTEYLISRGSSDLLRGDPEYDEYGIRYEDDFSAHFRGSSYRDRRGRLRSQAYSNHYGTRSMQLASHKGSVTYKSDGSMVVPSNWKALRVAGYDDYEYDERQSLPRLGGLADATTSLIKAGCVKLAAHSDDGRHFYLQIGDNPITQGLSYKQASIDLVQRVGLTLDDAEEVLQAATDDRTCNRLVKVAQVMPTPMVGVNMPQPPMPGMGMDPYSGLPMQDMAYEQQVQGNMTGLPPPPDSNAPGIGFGGDQEHQVDPEAQQLAEQAAGAGQKRIFDHASIGGLSKVFDTGAVLDSYVPELMKAMDRIGRILFLFYWNNADFSERYGTDDLAEMEDSLRNVFKSFGSLVLQLRRKSIGAEDSPSITV